MAHRSPSAEQHVLINAGLKGRFPFAASFADIQDQGIVDPLALE